MYSGIVFLYMGNYEHIEWSCSQKNNIRMIWINN